MNLTRARRTGNAILTLVLMVIGISWSLQHAVAAGARFLADPGRKSSAVPSIRCAVNLRRFEAGFPATVPIADEIVLDSDTVYETFSVIKLAIAAELVHQVESGRLSLSDRITTKAADERLPSGVLYALEPGLNPTVKDLLTLMIVVSDNEAIDLLAEKVGRTNVTDYMHSLGLTKTSIQFSDLDWDRTWLGTLDSNYKSARGDQTVEFPFGNYSDAQVQEAFGHTIYDADIYFGHSTTRKIGRLLEMVATGKLVRKTPAPATIATTQRHYMTTLRV